MLPANCLRFGVRDAAPPSLKFGPVLYPVARSYRFGACEFGAHPPLNLRGASYRAKPMLMSVTSRFVSDPCHWRGLESHEYWLSTELDSNGLKREVVGRYSGEKSGLYWVNPVNRCFAVG